MFSANTALIVCKSIPGISCAQRGWPSEIICDSVEFAHGLAGHPVLLLREIALALGIG